MSCFNRNETTEEEVRSVVKESINAVNQSLKLNVPLGSSADFGTKYSEIH